jgi:outer membrane protein assembly factor BamB
MVITDGVLFVAGPPDVVDPDDPLGAFEGRKGGVLCAIDPSSGQTTWKFNLPMPTVFNGLIATSGRLYVAMQGGSIACFGKCRSEGVSLLKLEAASAWR